MIYEIIKNKNIRNEIYNKNVTKIEISIFFINNEEKEKTISIAILTNI